MNSVHRESNSGLPPDQLHLLHIYLRNHEAAAAGGLQLFRRCASANRGTAYGADLQRLTDEVRNHRDDLRRICRSFGVKCSNVGRALAHAGATLGRIKPNGRVFRYSPLSRVIELEALSSGVMSQLRLWESLMGVSTIDLRLDEAELSRLASETNGHLQTLRRLHAMAASEALT